MPPAPAPPPGAPAPPCPAGPGSVAPETPAAGGVPATLAPPFIDPAGVLALPLVLELPPGAAAVPALPAAGPPATTLVPAPPGIEADPPGLSSEEQLAPIHRVNTATDRQAEKRFNGIEVAFVPRNGSGKALDQPIRPRFQPLLGLVIAFLCALQPLVLPSQVSTNEFVIAVRQAA